MVTLSFVVPGKPVPLPRARVVAHGSRHYAYTPKEAVEHKEKIRVYAVAAIYASEQSSKFPLKGEVSLFVMAASKRKATSRPDASNICKLVEDSLQGLVYLDDAQIVELVVRKEKLSEMAYQGDWTRIMVIGKL